jgi:predicted NBD/HSP70 family sugar kinase
VAKLSPAAETCVDGWIGQAAEHLYVPLEAVNCLINPGVVLVGGRLPSAIVERLAERAHDLLCDQATNVPVIAPVARAALSDDAPAVGAAILPFSHFLLPKPGALWKVPATSNANGRAIQPAR